MRRSLPVVLLGSLCVVSIAQATTYMPGRKGRHQDLFRRPIPAASHRPETRAGLLGAGFIGNLRVGQKPEVDNFSYQSCSITPVNDSTFTNPEMVPIALVTNPVCVLRYGDHDGRRSIRGAARHRQLHDDRACGSRHAYRIGNHYRPVRQNCVQREFAFHVMHPGLNSPAAPNRPRPTPPRPSPPRPTPH